MGLLNLLFGSGSYSENQHLIKEVEALKAENQKLTDRVKELENVRPQIVVANPLISIESLATRQFVERESIDLIRRISAKLKVDHIVIHAIAIKESSLRPFAVRVETKLPSYKWYRDAINKVGLDPNNLWNTASYGLLQVLFATALDYIKLKSPFELLVPEVGLRAGILHFKKLSQKYSFEDALSAYNYGYPTPKNRDVYVEKIKESIKFLRNQ